MTEFNAIAHFRTAAMDLPHDASFHFTPDYGNGEHRLELHGGGEPLGHLVWNSHDGDIGMVKTHQKYRRRGIGTALMSKAHDLADEHGLAHPEGSGFWTGDGSALRDSFDKDRRPSVKHLPTETHGGSGTGSTDLRQHMINDHGFGSSADMINSMDHEALNNWHSQVSRFDPCGFQHQAVKQTYDAPEGGGHGRSDHAGADERGGVRGRDAAPARDGQRPQHGQPERAAAPRRRVRAAAEVERHPELQGDLDRLGGGARHVQDTITALQHGRSGVTSYPLSHPLEGWHAAITSGGHQVVHRTDPDTKTLHVGYAGHNVADAEQRLGASHEGGSLPVEFHKGAEKDFDGLHPEVQEKALNTIDRLARGEQHKYDHALNGGQWENGGWRSARADFLHRVTHRFEDADGNPTSPESAHRLFIGHIGPHNYEAAQKRLSGLTDFFRTANLQQTASVDDDGKMMHRAPGPHNAPLHDPTHPSGEGGAFNQEDLDNPDWGSIGEPHEESLAAVHRTKGKPDTPVTIYRSVPHGVSHIRTGDWVSTSSQYAREHGMHPDDPSKDWPVLKATVPAKHVHTDGNDINEWGYNGPHIEHPAVHGPDEEWTEPTHHTASLQLTEAEERLLQRQAAAVANGDGVMVAFVPPPEVAEQLALHGGQLVDDLHITLAYLGNAADYTKEQLALLPQLVSAWAMRQKAVTIHIGGVGTFNNAYKDQHVLWAHPDIPGGVQMHVSLADYLERYGYRLPSEHGWTAHMTLQYVDRHKRFMPQLPAVGWEATEVVTFVGTARHAARLGLRPSTPTTL